jgi:hypothetical protein
VMDNYGQRKRSSAPSLDELGLLLQKSKNEI